MIKKIIETIFSRGITAICNFLAVILTAKYLGAELRGEIVLTLLSVSVVNLFQAILSGPVLTYFAPKESLKKLFLIAFSWSLICTFFVSALLMIFDLHEVVLWKELIIMSFFMGIISISQSILLGKEDITKQNIIEIVKSSSAILMIVFYLFVMNTRSIDAIYSAYIFAFAISSALGILFIYKYIKNDTNTSQGNLIPRMFRYGMQLQVNNISQMLNYRFVFYIIEKWKGKETLGVFSVAISIGEVVWIISRSIANYQYSKIVNSEDSEYQRKITVVSTKISLFATLVAVSILLMIPTQVFTWLFGNEFVDVKWILSCFSIGIITLSIYIIFSHYFSGTDKNWINIKASLLGNIVTIPVGMWLINDYSIYGGAFTYGIANTCTLFYFVYKFCKHTNTPLKSFIPKRKDYIEIKESY